MAKITKAKTRRITRKPRVSPEVAQAEIVNPLSRVSDDVRKLANTFDATVLTAGRMLGAGQLKLSAYLSALEKARHELRDGVTTLLDIGD